MLGGETGFIEPGKEVRPPGHSAFIALFFPPVVHLPMVARQQHLRHLSTMPLLRPGVLWVLQQTVPVGLVGVAALLRQHPRHHPAQAVRQRHGRYLAAGQHEVPHGDLLVHALVVAAHQNQPLIGCLQLLGHLLVKHPPTGGEIDGVYPLPRLLADMVPAAVQRVRLHDGSPASAVGIIIHLHLLIGGVLPDLVSGNGHQSSGLRPPDNGLPHHGVDGVREQGHDVNPHPWPVLSCSAPAWCRSPCPPHG